MKAIAYSPLNALFAVAPGLRRATDHTLSLYLPARSEGYDDRYYDILFGDVLHRYRERLGRKELEVLDAELPRLRAHIGIVRPAGCAALGAFAQTAPDLLELIALPLSTPERLEVGEVLLAPALRQLENVEPALVAVVDKEEARLFGCILDEVFATGHVTGVEVRHSKAGGTSAASNQRRAENRARANLDVAATETIRELRTGVYASLLVAGPDEARGEFEKLLPADLRATITGRLGASLESPTLKADLRRELSVMRLAGQTA
jgi:Bacterial archaeo-eukaryotic release factor family 10